MTIEIGTGLASLLTSFITTLGGVLVLWLTNRNEFRKATIAREATAVALAQKTEDMAREVVAQTKETAQTLKEQTAADATVKAVKLEEIHTLVNSRLTEALDQVGKLNDEIGDLKKTIGGLIAASGQGLTKGETDTLRTQAEAQIASGEQKP